MKIIEWNVCNSHMCTTFEDNNSHNRKQFFFLLKKSYV